MKYLGATAQDNDFATKAYVDDGIKWHSNPNLLDNWYFVGGGSQQGGGQFPINQRGYTSYTGSLYGIDRWRQWDNAGTVTIGNGYVTFTKAFFQVLESGTFNALKSIAGTLTLSYLTNAGELVYGTSPYRAGNEPWGSGLNVGGYFNVQSGGTVGIYPAYDEATSIIAIKLELGDHQTLANQDTNGNWVLNDPPPNYQQELAKCQRYQIELVPTFDKDYGIVGVSGNVFSGLAATCYVFVPTPVPLCNRPSISYSGNWSLAPSGAANASAGVAVSSISLDRVSQNGVGLAVDAASSLDTSKSYSLWRVEDSHNLLFDANL